MDATHPDGAFAADCACDALDGRPCPVHDTLLGVPPSSPEPPGETSTRRSGNGAPRTGDRRGDGPGA